MADFPKNLLVVRNSKICNYESHASLNLHTQQQTQHLRSKSHIFAFIFPNPTINTCIMSRKDFWIPTGKHRQFNCPRKFMSSPTDTQVPTHAYFPTKFNLYRIFGFTTYKQKGNFGPLIHCLKHATIFRPNAYTWVNGKRQTFIILNEWSCGDIKKPKIYIRFPCSNNVSTVRCCVRAVIVMQNSVWNCCIHCVYFTIYSNVHRKSTHSHNSLTNTMLKKEIRKSIRKILGKIFPYRVWCKSI